MRIKLSENPRPDFVIVAARNAESTAAIPRGTPIVLNLSSAPQPTSGADGFAAGYEDGLQVVLPSTAGANPTALFPFGVAVDTIANGQLGEALVFGVVAYALVVRATRAASTDSWSASATSSSAGGFLLSIDTVNNAFRTYAPSSISLANASSIVTSGGIDIQKLNAQAVMLDSMATFSASASATSDTRTIALVGYRAFIRMM